MRYEASLIKRVRRSNAELSKLRADLYDIVEENQPATVRQIYYRAVVAGMIPKTEAGYQTVGRLLVEMRRDGRIPWGWITDHTRAMRRPRTYSDPTSAAAQTAAFYRRALWADLPVRVEIWCEKDALAGVLSVETFAFDVPLMITRGYPSLSFLHDAGEEIAEEGKPTFIYYFGDHDPSGVDIPVKVEAGLRDFAPNAAIHFERVAVLPDQIREMGLPTRPTKASDTRAKTFDGDSVEVDAIAPADLRRLCRHCIFRHIDDDQLRVHTAAEQSERALLQQWSRALARGMPH